MTTRKYDKTKLDLQYKNKNETLEFYISDTETSDFYIKITRANMPIKLNNVIIVLCVVDPKYQFRSQLINENPDKEGVIYCKLDKSMKSFVGDYQAKVMLVYEDEKIVTDTFTYTVKNDMFVALNQEIVTDERFQTLNDMLGEISKVKNQEEIRNVSEGKRIIAEDERLATIEIIKSEITQLTLDVNSKINANISENTNKTNELVSSVSASVDTSLNLNTLKVDGLIVRGNETLSQVEVNTTNLIASVEEYKHSVTSNIETYKTTKDSEINQSLLDYKTLTTQSINVFVDGEILKIRNDIVEDTNTYKATLNSEFTKLGSDLKLNVSDFILTKSNYIDNYLSTKTLELTKYINDKNIELDNYVTVKTNELNDYMVTKTGELDTYKTNKNTEINNFFNDKNTEFNNNEKLRASSESRRETNEYSRGMNEVNRKNVEDKRNTEFNAMKSSFNQMIKFNIDGNLEVTINGVTKVFVPK